MSIKKIDKNELRGYEGKEGLILQGCGGNPQEWVDGINELFTKEGILLDGTKFGDDNCAVFENNGLTCLLYEFNDDTKVDIGNERYLLQVIAPEYKAAIFGKAGGR